MQQKFRLAIFFMTLPLTACVTHPASIEFYADQKPELQIQNYFNGDLHGYGMVTDKKNKLIDRYVGETKAEWHNNHGLIQEKFHFADGAEKHREWCVQLTDPHHFLMVTNYYSGLAQGEQYGNAIHVTYRIRVPENLTPYTSLSTRGELLDRISQSPEYKLYHLATPGGVFGEIMTLHSFQSLYVPKPPPHADIGPYCKQQMHAWNDQASGHRSMREFELNEWLFSINDKIVIQKTQVTQHGVALGESTVALCKGKC
jgi:hypothetical protein